MKFSDSDDDEIDSIFKCDNLRRQSLRTGEIPAGKSPSCDQRDRTESSLQRSAILPYNKNCEQLHRHNWHCLAPNFEHVCELKLEQTFSIQTCRNVFFKHLMEMSFDEVNRVVAIFDLDDCCTSYNYMEEKNSKHAVKHIMCKAFEHLAPNLIYSYIDTTKCDINLTANLSWSSVLKQIVETNLNGIRQMFKESSLLSPDYLNNDKFIVFIFNAIMSGEDDRKLFLHIKDKYLDELCDELMIPRK